MPKFDKPVFFTHKVKAHWKQFWTALEDEEPCDLPTIFAEATEATDTSSWDWEPDNGAKAFTHWEFDGFAFLAKFNIGSVLVIDWLTIDGHDRTKKVFRRKTKSSPATPAPADAFVPEFTPIPTDLPPLELREWLRNELATAERLADGLTGVARRRVGRRTLALNAAMSQIKKSCHAQVMAAEFEGESDRILIQPDGMPGGLVPCVRYLLRRVAELDAELKQLKGVQS